MSATFFHDKDKRVQADIERKALMVGGSETFEKNTLSPAGYSLGAYFVRKAGTTITRYHVYKYLECHLID